MWERFFPDDMFACIQDLPAEYFQEHGIELVILDIDNTLVPYTVAEPTPAALSFLGCLEDAGVAYCFVSNNSAQRVELFNRSLNAFYVARAKKPFRGGIQSAMAHFGMTAQQTLLIGDQIFTDVWGGRRCGVRTVLVKPIENRETLFFKLKRVMEKIVLKQYRKEKNHA